MSTLVIKQAIETNAPESVAVSKFRQKGRKPPMFCHRWTAQSDFINHLLVKFAFPPPMNAPETRMNGRFHERQQGKEYGRKE